MYIYHILMTYWRRLVRSESMKPRYTAIKCCSNCKAKIVIHCNSNRTLSGQKV